MRTDVLFVPAAVRFGITESLQTAVRGCKDLAPRLHYPALERGKQNHAGFRCIGVTLVDAGVVRAGCRPSDQRLRYAVPAPGANAPRSAPAYARGAAHAPLAVVDHGDRHEGMGRLSPEATRVR